MITNIANKSINPTITFKKLTLSLIKLNILVIIEIDIEIK